MRIAVDAMTSELGVEAAIHGIFDALALDPELQVLAVGRPEVLEPLLQAGPSALRARVELVPATEVIGMDEEPGASFKAKKDASVTVCARLVKEGRAQAAISAGNTGASMTAATLILGRVPGVRRPALLTPLPTGNGFTGLLDAGAVVDCRPEDLLQFAIMGSLYWQNVMGVASPKVGLLSIGEEEKKGNSLTAETFPLLKTAPINFMGNVEGRDLFNGHCDVAVCDGFVGNIVLKTAEGLGKMMITQLKELYRETGPLAKLGGLLSKPVFAGLRKRVDPQEFGGAALLGVNGNFIITHGRSSRIMFKNGIRVASRCASQDVSGRLVAAFKENA